MYLSVYTFLLIVPVIIQCKDPHFPSYVTPCKRYDPVIEKCWRKNFNTVVPLMKNAIPEANLRALEPLKVEKINLELGEQTRSVNFVAQLLNVRLYGLSKTTLDQIHITNNLTEYFVSVDVNNIYLESDYKATGKVLLLAFNTTGSFWGNYSDIHVTMKFNGTTYKKKGRDHYIFQSQDIKMTVKDIKMHFNNIFPNNLELTESINKAINDDIFTYYDEVQDIVLETIKSIVLTTLNDFCAFFPADIIFPID